MLVALLLMLTVCLDSGLAQDLHPVNDLRHRTQPQTFGTSQFNGGQMDTRRFHDRAQAKFQDDQPPAVSMGCFIGRERKSPIGFDLNHGDLQQGILSAAELRTYLADLRRQPPQHQRRGLNDRSVGQANYWEPVSAVQPQAHEADLPVDSSDQVTNNIPSVAEAFPASAVSPPAETYEQISSSDNQLGNPVGPSGPTAQEGPNAPVGPSVSEGTDLEVPISQQEIGQLHKTIQTQLELASQLQDPDRERHLQNLESARKALTQANKFMWKDIKQNQKTRNFETEKKRLIELLEQHRSQAQPEQGKTAEELFAELEQLRANLLERNERLREINKSELQQKKRMERIPEEHNKAKAALAENRQNMKEQENGESNVDATVLLRAKELELEYKIKALESESVVHELENRLLPIRVDDLTREIKLLETEIELWNFAANEQRRKDIAEEVRQARSKAIEAAPALRELANANADLTQRRADFAEKIRAASQEDLSVQAQLNEVKNHHETAEKSIVGNDQRQPNGILLVEIRRQLPMTFRSRARIVEMEADLRKINLEQLDLNEERRRLSHPNEYVDQKLTGVTSSSLTPEDLRDTALEFVEGIRAQHDQLSSDHHQYAKLLHKIIAERKELVSEIETTKKFVDEQTLWIPSAKSIGLDHVAKTRHGATAFFSPSKWIGLVDRLTTRICQKPHESAVGIIGLVGLFGLSRRFQE